MTRPMDKGEILNVFIEAVYGGYERPSDDVGQLRAIADYLDHVDDVADRVAIGIASDFRVNRGIQSDLRRIADRIEQAA